MLTHDGDSIDLTARACWLFDMDGTLTVAMHDFDAMRTALDLPAGVPILEALAAMPQKLAVRKRAALDAMELDMAAGATAQPGSVALLERLSADGAALGIVTRNGRDIADATLAACGLDRYFDSSAIISRDCCIAKPDPAGVQLAMQRLGNLPSDSVMVGDYRFDLEAGRRAGTATVHMDTTGTYSWPEFTDVGVTSLAALLSLIDRADPGGRSCA